jgi:hypothetical protein
MRTKGNTFLNICRELFALTKYITLAQLYQDRRSRASTSARVGKPDCAPNFVTFKALA